MKKLLLLTLLVLASKTVTAQCEITWLSISSQEQIDEFLTLNPTCTEVTGSIVLDQSPATPITNLSAFQNIVSVSGDIKIIDISVTNLEGLNNITSIGGNLELESNSLNDISALSNLDSVGGDLRIYNTDLSSFSALNNLQELGGSFTLHHGGWLDVDPLPLDLQLNIETIQGDLILTLPENFTSIDGFSSIITVEGNIDIQGMGLTSLAGLNNLESVGGYLYISSIPMENIDDFESLTSVGGLLNIHTLYATTNITGFNALESVGGFSLIGCTMLQSISGFSALTQINGGHLSIVNCELLPTLDGLENLTSLNSSNIDISGNTLLEDISALQSLNPSTIAAMGFGDNLSLSVCNYPNICYYMQMEGANFNVGNNAQGCDTVEQVTEACNAPTTNTITGTIKYNYDNNDCGTAIYTAPGIIVKAIDDEGVEYTTFTAANGEYNLFVPEGEYIITPVAPPGGSMTPDDSTASFTEVGDEHVTNFCLGGLDPINDVAILISPIAPAMPGFDASYLVQYENKGTAIADGTITFQYDAEKLTLLLSSVAPDSNSDGTLSWNYTGLLPFQQEGIQLTFNVIAPPINNNGEVLSYTASVTPLDGDAMVDNNTANFEQELIGSYDPNDKTVLEGEEVVIENASNYLTYRIRFQNTGTAPAVFIRLEDQLDENLDWDTFEPIAASHDYRVELVDGFLKVYFDDIFLPAEEDDQAGSNGFFMYRIKPKEGMAIGDSIENTASIFFDYNLPIITNTVTTEFVEMAGIADNDLLQVAVYPNPANSVLNFKASVAITAVELYNGLGQKVIALKVDTIDSLNISQLANGVYFCHLHDGYGNTSIQKIIINK